MHFAWKNMEQEDEAEVDIDKTIQFSSPQDKVVSEVNPFLITNKNPKRIQPLEKVTS